MAAASNASVSTLKASCWAVCSLSGSLEAMALALSDVNMRLTQAGA